MIASAFSGFSSRRVIGHYKRYGRLLDQREETIPKVGRNRTYRSTFADETVAYKVDNLLPANNADLAAVSANGSAYLYHYVSAAHTENYGIRELVIRGSPQSGLRQESYNMTEPLVTSPLMLGGNNASLYQPLAASITAVRDLSPQFLVLWADKPTGDPNTNNTGYQNLAQVSRPAKGDSWPSGTQLTIPLGSEDSEPH